MRHLRGLAALFVLLSANFIAADEPLPKELQGEWRTVDVEFSGERPTEEFLGKLAKERILVKGDVISLPQLSRNKDGFFIPEEDPLKLRCEYNPKAKEIDLFFKSEDKEIRMLGIYALENNRLKICWQHDGKARPKEFKTVEKPSQMLWVMERRPGRPDEPVGVMPISHSMRACRSSAFSLAMSFLACSSGGGIFLNPAAIMAAWADISLRFTFSRRSGRCLPRRRTA